MMVDEDKVVSICSRYNITFEQFMFLWILYKDKMRHRGKRLPSNPSESVPVANIYRYSSNVRPWSTNKELDVLMDKDLLKALPGYDRNNPVPDQLEVTDKFCEEIFLSGEHFKVFWKEYPGFVDNFDDSRGSKIPLKAANKRELEKTYKDIVTTLDEHDRNMEAVVFARENDLISMGIKKWINGELWNDVLREKEKSPGSGESWQQKIQ